MDINNIILNAKNGDKKALQILIKEFQPSIYSMLYYLKKDKTDILDIMQDILIKITKKITQLKDVNNFKVWLNKIVLNAYYDYMRKNQKLKFIDSDDKYDIIDNQLNPQTKILYNELDFIIKNSIASLPIHYKIPITLREIQGLSYGEISNLTKTTVGTVKSRISRARTLIQNDIDKYIKD